MTTPATTTVGRDVRYSFGPATTSTVTYIRDPQRQATTEEVLGQPTNRKVSLSALVAAGRAFPWLRQELRAYGWTSSVSRSGEAFLTFVRGRRYAILKADADGDLVLTLTDRSTEDEAEVAVIETAAIVSLPKRIAAFLGA